MMLHCYKTSSEYHRTFKHTTISNYSYLYAMCYTT